MAISLSHSPHNTTQAQKVAKIALQCFIAAVCVLPAGILWLIGRGICCLSNAQINYAKLSSSPKPIQVVAGATDYNINLMVLYTKYVALGIKENLEPGKTSKEDCLRLLCNKIQTAHQDIYPDNANKRFMFCQQVSLYLKAILQKMRSGDIDNDKEEQILKELAEASTRCYPTWLQTAYSLYADVHNQEETVPDKLLRAIQEYKESLTLEFVQNELGLQWHALNFVRNILGAELGFDTELNELDPYGGQQDNIFGKALTKWLFLQKYTDVNRLVEAIRTKINAKPFDSSYYDYLVEKVESSQQGDIQEIFYDENYQLTYEGVSFMLHSMKILR